MQKFDTAKKTKQKQKIEFDRILIISLLFTFLFILHFFDRVSSKSGNDSILKKKQSTLRIIV